MTCPRDGGSPLDGQAVRQKGGQAEISDDIRWGDPLRPLKAIRPQGHKALRQSTLSVGLA